MEVVEMKVAERNDAGEAEMEHLTEVVEKVKQFCEENRIRFEDVHKSLNLFEKMGWEL